MSKHFWFKFGFRGVKQAILDRGDIISIPMQTPTKFNETSTSYEYDESNIINDNDASKMFLKMTEPKITKILINIIF